MKKVILLGDSIRVGYQPFVTEKLKGWAEVWAPETNCRHSRFTRENLAEWALDKPADIIHVNVGLHDMSRFDKQAPEGTKLEDVPTQIPFDEYKNNVRYILETLVNETSAKVIWRTTTPSLLERQIAIGKSPKRLASDVPKFNVASIEIARNVGVPIHDMYHQIMGAGVEDLLGADGIHYPAESNEKLADWVITELRENA